MPNSLEFEVRRRRFWACYLTQCALGESLTVFESITDVLKFTLPWGESDFDAGTAQDSDTYLDSGRTDGRIFAELIKAFTMW